MVNKELRKLSRRELVEIIFQMKRNEEKLQEKISEQEKALEERRIRISNAGSIAEAATEISNIFDAAQAAADVYLQEVAKMKEDARKECEKMVEDVRQRIENVLNSDKYQDNTSTQYLGELKKVHTLRAMEEQIRGMSEEEKHGK